MCALRFCFSRLLLSIESGAPERRRRRARHFRIRRGAGVFLAEGRSNRRLSLFTFSWPILSSTFQCFIIIHTLLYIIYKACVKITRPDNFFANINVDLGFAIWQFYFYFLFFSVFVCSFLRQFFWFSKNFSMRSGKSYSDRFVDENNRFFRWYLYRTLCLVSWYSNWIFIFGSSFSFLAYTSVCLVV